MRILLVILAALAVAGGTGFYVMQGLSAPTGEVRVEAPKLREVFVPAQEIAVGREFVQRVLEEFVGDAAGGRGRVLLLSGEAGSGNEANLARLRRKPADLTNKERMTAMTDGELFWKVSKGINGIMPAGERRMNEEERWHVVNYIRTLAKDKQ